MGNNENEYWSVAEFVYYNEAADMIYISTWKTRVQYIFGVGKFYYLGEL
jgi:hypothetical protein